MYWEMTPEYCALLILLIIWTYEKRGSSIPSLKNIIFRCCLVITFLSISCNIISTYMIEYYTLVPSPLIWIFTTAYFLLIPIMGLFYFSYIAAVIYNKEHIVKRIMLWSGIPALLSVCVILSNYFTKFIFDITDLGYVRGPYLLSNYLIFYLYCILSVICVCLNSRRLTPKTTRLLMIFPTVSTLIIIFQQTHPYIILSGFSATSSLLIMYLHIQNRQIYIDYLTKLPNRWELINMIDYIIEHQKTKTFSLIVMSTKEFKMVNDRFGQQIGDSFLKVISKELIQHNPSNTVYRFNGDEFAILLPKSINVHAHVKQLQQQMNKMWSVKGYNCYLSFAFGIVSYSEHYKTTDMIIQSIEYAIIEAKKNCKNNVCFYNKDMFLKMERKKQIIEILKQKLLDKSFEMYYQPIYSNQYQNFAYIESLIRMNDTPIGPIYPNEFIPIAEESGIIIELTYVILEKVCQFVKEAIENNITFECVHVNFSPIQFSQIDLANRVIDIINKYQIPAHKIKIEFTESAIADSTEAVINFANKMNSYGIKMGLDDFGTGYSNISTVMSIPFHAIKLDKSLIYKAMEETHASGLIESVVTAFHSINLQVVAEGVETQEQLDKVNSFGIDQIQGYYFSKPLPKQEALQFLKLNKKTK